MRHTKRDVKLAIAAGLAASAAFALVLSGVLSLWPPAGSALLWGLDLLTAVAAGTVVAVTVLRELARRTAPQIPGPPEASTNVKSEFLANISHEMRTPLNGILGLVQLLLATKPTAQQREYLDLAKSSGDSLLHIINDILALAKIEAGKMHFESVGFRLRKTIRESVKPLAPQAHQKNLEIAYWVAPDVPNELEGDPSRLRQVLVNLVSNAIKFTDRGEVVLKVDLESHNAEDVTLHFTVADTGIGIAASRHQLVFDSFAQGDRSTRGTGLGLAIASRLVELMGGRIWLESAEGKGSRFHFTARLGTLETQADETDPSEDELRGLRTLIVEDNETHRDLLLCQFELWGADPVAAADGRAALAAIEASAREDRRFSLLLADSRLPDMSGVELGRAILDHCTIPGILMTLSHEAVDPAELRSHGFLGHLTKPMAATHLRRAIGIILRGATVERPEDVQTQPLTRLRIGGGRVLLAEDHPVNRTVASRMLQGMGSQVVEVVNGREAVRVSASEHFDLILMDVEMPEMDGIEATRAIRARETGDRRTPILALTAHARPEDELRCREAGMDAFLSKPFQEEDLVAAIDRLLAPGDAPATSSAEAGASPDPFVFDRREALARASKEPLLLAELTTLLLQEIPRTNAGLRRAIASGDATTIERGAHRLKGSLVMLSAKRAAGAARALEQAAVAGQLDACDGRLTALEQELELLEPELRAVAAETKS